MMDYPEIDRALQLAFQDYLKSEIDKLNTRTIVVLGAVVISMVLLTGYNGKILEEVEHQRKCRSCYECRG